MRRASVPGFAAGVTSVDGLHKRRKYFIKKHNCFKILGENCTTEKLSTMDAFDHLKILELVGITLHYRIAWMNQVPETAKEVEFIETVIVRNRGMANGRIFPTVEEAKRWLPGKENE